MIRNFMISKGDNIILLDSRDYNNHFQVLNLQSQSYIGSANMSKI